MQRVLLVIVLVLLLTASLAIGTYAAAWPFWSRAQAWRAAPDGWPAAVPGPARPLHASGQALPLEVRVDPGLAAAAIASGAQLLLVSDGPASARAWFAAGFDESSPVDGRGLAPGLLPLVYAVLEQRHPGLLDQPLGTHLREWRRDARGRITPRQLMWELGGLATGSHRPWNPFDPQAQLLAGPDFTRAALAVRQVYPAGTVHTPSMANAQLLALLAGRVHAGRYADLLEQALWRRVASREASAMLDHRRGEIAAHCCVTASAADWLRVAQLFAQPAVARSRLQLQQPAQALAGIGTASAVNPGQGLVWRVERAADTELLLLRTAGRLLAAAPDSGRALFWAGSGELPPEQVARLLAAAH